jgi:hypothetical protein
MQESAPFVSDLSARPGGLDPRQLSRRVPAAQPPRVDEDFALATSLNTANRGEQHLSPTAQGDEHGDIATTLWRTWERTFDSMRASLECFSPTGLAAGSLCHCPARANVAQTTVS